MIPKRVTMRSIAERTCVAISLLAGVLAAAPAGDVSATTHGHAMRVERVGFRGAHKVGTWTPIWIRVADADRHDDPELTATAVDGDGVAVTVRAPASRSATAGATDIDGDTMLLYTKVGRIDGAIDVALSAGGKVVERQTLRPNDLVHDDVRIHPLRATSQLIVQVGQAPSGLPEAYPDRDAAAGELGRRFVRLEAVDELPDDWSGYEAVDVLVLAIGDAPLFHELAADQRRLAAIERWLELGGRLVVVGGRGGPDFFADGQPLVRFVPGRFVDLVPLRETRGLENFAETPDPIGGAGGRLAIPVPWLADVEGHVIVDGRDGDLPLVIRAPRGFGELVFVGVDLDVAPLAEWSGRTEFWRGLLRPCLADANTRESTTLVSLGYDDLAGAVGQQLGRSFRGVAPITFPVVIALVVSYLVLLGPLDYLFVHKFLRRPAMAWVTFPLLVLAFGGGALLVAPTRRAAGTLQVNQAEVVDFDLATGRVRGTAWATLYSPDARRFDLALAPRLPGDAVVRDAEALVSWLGLPGSGRGGMHARGIDLDLTQAGYDIAPQRDALRDVPVLTGSTKSLSARWSGTTGPLLTFDLEANEDGLLVGKLTNETGQTLHDAALMYGLWGYRLGDVAAGQPLDIGPQLSAIQVRTLLARRADTSPASGDDPAQRALFAADRASTDQLLCVMMFYQAAGGYSFVGLPNQYQAYCDLSQSLALGRAILVARGDGGSRLVDESAPQPQPIPTGESTVMVRFVIPVEEE